MRRLVGIAAVAAVAAGLTVGAQNAQAVTLGFSVLEDNSPIDLSGQLFVEVLDAGGGLVSFGFQNLGPLASSITGIYFDGDGVIEPPLTVDSQSAGVSFTAGSAAPPDLPGKENATPPFSTTAGLLADSDSGPPGTQANGINPGEWLVLLATAVSSFDSVITALISGDLRIGLHVQGLLDGASETYINTPPSPIPLPAGLLLFLSGLAGIGFLGRYKAKRSELAAA